MTNPPTPTTSSAPARHGAQLATDLGRLRERLNGEVVVPGDPTYPAAAAGWNTLIVHRPEVIVVAADPGDVAAAIRFANDHDLGVGVQATGHGSVVPVDGVLLRTERLDEVSVDQVRGTARIGAGCTWAPVLAAAQRHGLAPLVGSSSRVGVVGYTLGGGLGWLARQFGPACGAVEEFDLVTGDGRLVRASADENSDLFQALRGGGGGAFGIVTAVVVRLVPVSDVYAGSLLYPIESAIAVAERWARWAPTTPPEMTSSLVFMNFPEQSFVIVRGCWCGDLREGERLIGEWCDRMPPLSNHWRVMPFAANDSISEDPTDPTPVVSSGGWLERVDGDVAAAIAEATFEHEPHLLFSEVRHVGGALSKAESGTTAMSGGDHEFLVHSIGTPTHRSADEIRSHTRTMYDQIAEAMSSDVPLNFLTGDERRIRTVDGIGSQHASRLAAVLRHIDPSDRFRYGVDHTRDARSSSGAL